jgi:hypothetical protein
LVSKSVRFEKMLALKGFGDDLFLASKSFGFENVCFENVCWHPMGSVWKLVLYKTRGYIATLRLAGSRDWLGAATQQRSWKSKTDMQECLSEKLLRNAKLTNIKLHMELASHDVIEFANK